jgi:hypothetical protein
MMMWGVQPPLPDKSFDAKFEETKEIKRLQKLKEWLTR